MKTSLLFFIVSIVCIPIIGKSQSLIPAGEASTYIHCTRFYISKPIRELPDYKVKPGSEPQESADDIEWAQKQAMRSAFHPSNDYSDPIRQTSAGTVIGSIAPLVNFQGTTEFSGCPGDPNGAVDSTYYVQTINENYTVFDKHGNVVMPTKDLGTLWTGIASSDGDPVVLYDKFADRWFISEFQVSFTPYQLLVGVSTTNDPTGSYYVWEFSTGNMDPDYPKYSIWTDGYYITFQGFVNGTPIVPQQVGVLERSRLLRGDPNAGLILANLPTPPDFLSSGPMATGISEPKTLDCDASALPPFGTPNYLVYFKNVATGAYSNKIVMYKLETDTTAHTLAVSRADSFSVPTFNSYFTGGSRQDISQPGYPHGVSALDGRFSFRVPYMKFTGYNSVLLSNAVNLGNLVAGIRWYELRQNDTTQQWSIYQEGTYGPDDRVSRWNAAICMDYDGNIALAYSVADSAHLYPGIRYTGRRATDPLGQMTFAEQTAITGSATISCFYRWGDYSELDIDPSDGLTFWGINEYGDSANSNTSSFETSIQCNRIFSFKLEGNGTSGINEVQNQTDVKAYQDGPFLNVTAKGLPSNDRLTVDLFDISGRQLTTQIVEPVSNMFETKINVSTLPKGIYFIRVGRVNFQKVIKTLIN